MTQKLAETQYPVHDFIRSRWSPRAFSDRAVEPEKLFSLLEAARWAPSPYNHQPWSFIVATKDDATEYNRLLSTLVEFNQGWAKNPPVLILTVVNIRTDDGKTNRHVFHDVGLALENLILQATSLLLFMGSRKPCFHSSLLLLKGFKFSPNLSREGVWGVRFCVGFST